MTDAYDQVLALARARALGETGRGRAIRLRHQLALADVARAVGVATTTVWRWERCVATPTGPAALRWARLLGDLEELATDAAA